MSQVLVTGGAGYLGSVLVGRLLNAGHHVTVLDNLLYGQKSLLAYSGRPHFEFVAGDARDERPLKELLKTHDTVAALAAIVGAGACDREPEEARSVNFEALALLNRLRSPRQRVIYPCTNSGYGTKSGDLHCDEKTPLEPITLYGRTKVSAERELLNSPNTVSLRLATVFGPSPRLRLDLLVNDFVWRASKDGYLVIFEKDFKRNFVHIEDIADCFLFCLEHFDEMKGEAYNVGLDDANISKADLAMKIREHLPSLYIHYAEIGQDLDRRNYIVSNDKIRRKGFSARRSLDEGIRDLIRLYQTMPRDGYRNA